MKIISLSSSIAGPACAIGLCIKKHFYDNNLNSYKLLFLFMIFVILCGFFAPLFLKVV